MITVNEILDAQSETMIEQIKYENVNELSTTLVKQFKNSLISSGLPKSKNSISGVIADSRFNSVVVVETGTGQGTGFYVSDDVLLTAYHVVENHSLVKLRLFDGSETSGRVIAHDLRLDLALIKTNHRGKALNIHSGPIVLGGNVEAIGHPSGLDFSITRGVVSSLRKMDSLYVKGAPKVEFVQSDTPISPGNSGGPLFLKGNVIGVADFGRVDEHAQNLNFSVSFNEINKFLAENGIF